MKQLRIYFWNIKTSPGFIPLLLYWPKHDDTSAIFSQKSSCYKYKHTYLYHNINLLEYKVFSQWTVIEASSRLFALQARKYFQTFLLLYSYFFSILIPFPVQNPSKQKGFSRKTDKRYSWRVLTSCSTGSDPIPINVNMNLPLILKTGPQSFLGNKKTWHDVLQNAGGVGWEWGGSLHSNRV